jgi:hypothetical protein
MKRLLFALTLFCIPTLTFAQEPAPAAEPAATTEKAAPATSDIDTNKDGRIDSDETKALVDKDENVSDVVDGAGEAIDAAKNMKGKKGTELALAIALFLAALFKSLLSLIKVLKKSTNIFKTKKGKKILKLSTIGLGVLAAVGAGIANTMGAGFGWMEILMIGLSGPGSLAVHELTSKSKDSAEETEEKKEG